MKVKIWKENFADLTKIVFYDTDGHDIFVYNFYTQERKKLDPNQMCPEEFMLKVPRMLDQELFQALAEVLDEKGIKTDKDARIQGTLEATRYHLEDMRKLLKLIPNAAQARKDGLS